MPSTLIAEYPDETIHTGAFQTAHRARTETVLRAYDALQEMAGPDGRARNSVAESPDRDAQGLLPRREGLKGAGLSPRIAIVMSTAGVDPPETPGARRALR